MSKSKTHAIPATNATDAGTQSATPDCPVPLRETLRLALVTAADIDASKGQLQLFTRESTDRPWTAASRPHAAMLGAMGLAWGCTFAQYRRCDEPEKSERDKRTPAGFFHLGPSFGFEQSARANYIAIRPGETVCVEDPASPLYNTITQRARLAPQTRADNMSDSSLFRHGLFVAYPSDRERQCGSCIFVHIWRSPDTPTAGCVALPEPHVRELQDFAQDGAVLGVLFEAARERFAGHIPQRSPISN